MPDFPVEKLKNIGPVMKNALNEIGVFYRSDIEKLGIYEVYFRIQAIRPSLKHKMALYALFGAINDINCLFLPGDVKREVDLRYVEFLNS